MKILARIILILLSIAMGALFLYSAYTKTIPIQSFEYTMVEFAKLPWLAAAIGARFFIGLETALGALMIVHLLGKSKWVYKVAIWLLLIFSIYLIYLWVSVGNDVNCGCFGDAIWMSPSTSLLKNAGMLIILLLLNKFHKGFVFKRHNLVAILLFLIVLAVPYFVYPLPEREPQWMSSEQFALDMSSLYKAGKKDAPSVNLREGKYVLAFYSLKCPHCRIAAYKMHLMKEKNPNLPFFMVLAGPESAMNDFWEETKAQNIPYSKLEAEEFTDMIGYSFPVIYFLNDGVVEAKANYVTLDQQTIEDWLQK